MKAPSQSPDDWFAPNWPTDYGDPAVELEHLRAFASQFLKTVPSARISLEQPEPGLMYVSVKTIDGTTSEAYSIPTKGDLTRRRYGIFIAVDTKDEQEIYADSVDAAVTAFRMNSRTSGGA